MASKIEHLVKYDAYSDALAWSRGVEKESIIWFLEQKANQHKDYLKKVNNATHYGTPPKNRFLNWLGHKCLVWAWGRKSYLALRMSRDFWKEPAAAVEGPK